MSESRSEGMKRRQRMALEVAGGRRTLAVAEDFGVTPQTVRNACREYGVELERRYFGARTLEILAALIEDDHCTLSEVADRFGVSRQRVHKIKTDAQELGLLSG